MKHLKKYSFFIGLLLFLFVLSRAEPGKLWLVVKKINCRPLFLGILLHPVVLFIKSICWNYLKRVQKIRYKLSDSFLMFNAGVAIGALTPGRIGEVSRVLYLKKDGHPLGKSLATVAIDRISDLIALAALGYLGFLFLYGFFGRLTFYFELAAFTLIAAIAAFKKQIVRRLFKNFFLFFIPQRYKEKWRYGLGDFWLAVKTYTVKDYIIVFALTFLAWFAYYTQVYFFSLAVGLKEVSFLNLSLAVTASGLISVLPISFLGIGARDVTLVALLSPLTQNTEAIILLSQLILLEYALLAVTGTVSLLLRPIPLKKHVKK